MAKLFTTQNTYLGYTVHNTSLLWWKHMASYTTSDALHRKGPAASDYRQGRISWSRPGDEEFPGTPETPEFYPAKVGSRD